MRYAVISDIHSNLEALSAVIEKIDGLNVGKTVCLGDIVGYNADPNACVDLVRERGIACIMGNHDSCVAGLTEPESFNALAESAIVWTRENLSPENIAYLKGLRRSMKAGRSFLAVHGWIGDTDRYILGGEDALKNFALLKAEGMRVCFFGHTHVAIAYSEVQGSVILNVDNRLEISKGIYYLVNPGSVGQPRDRDPRASFAVYDTAEAGVTYYRVEYDVQATADKILKAGLPERLAERLKLGW